LINELIDGWVELNTQRWSAIFSKCFWI